MALVSDTAKATAETTAAAGVSMLKRLTPLVGIVGIPAGVAVVRGRL